MGHVPKRIYDVGIAGLQGSGRYVRLLGVRRGTAWGYSLWSFEVYGTPTSEPPATNLALNRPASALSAESQSFPGSNAFDGRMDTRWSSGFSDPQWIQVDLGQIVNISRVVLKWETAFGADYQIQAKDTPAGTWRIVTSVTNGNGGVDDLTNLSGTAATCACRHAPWNGLGYSLWEFEIMDAKPTQIPATGCGGTRATSILPCGEQLVARVRLISGQRNQDGDTGRWRRTDRRAAGEPHRLR
jgi:hypothetical protein